MVLVVGITKKRDEIAHHPNVGSSTIVIWIRPMAVLVADEEDLYKLYIALRRGSPEKQKMVTGLLKKVVTEVGSLEFQAKVKAL